MHIPVATWISRESVCHALSKIPQTAFVPVSDLLSIGWVTMKSVCCWLVLLSFLLLVQVHPRRPRGSQSGREKRRDESFHYGRKSPWVPTLTGPFPKIQADAGSWLGTKNALYYCAQSANSFSWVLFVSSYTTAIVSITACLAHAPKKCTQSGNFQFDIKSPSDPTRLLCQMQANFSEPYQSSWRENEFCYCLFTSFTKREIWHFHE